MNDKLKKDLDEYIGLINKYRDADNPFICLNNHEPSFTNDEIEMELEGKPAKYFELDKFGRCTGALARISGCTCPKNQDQNRRPHIKCKPTGFPAGKENLVNEKAIFQRCHLIGCQLITIKDTIKGGKKANLTKVFTGTRFMNNVMFYFEKRIADHVKETKGYVLYCVIPYFENDNKIAYGVQMEAKFINENGEEDKNLSFNIFVYNKQPYIEFNYKTGRDLLEKMLRTDCRYILDEKKKKFHISGCASAWNLDNDRKRVFLGKRETLTKYHPCGICDPGIRK